LDAGKVTGPAGGRIVDRVVLAVVIAVALAIASATFAAYYAHPDDLWRDIYHDRNAHLSVGMNFAMTARAGDVGGFVSQLLAMRVWGPVHGLLLGLVFLVGGADHRLAILPSLAGWVMTAVLSAAVARRLFADRTLGLFAAATTEVWLMTSPAFRLLCSDVMLEGLGAGLSALGLWAYLRAREQPQSGARWRLLALTLTALFFHKANYWGLLCAALAISAALERVDLHSGWAPLRARLSRLGRPAARWLFDPLIFAAAALGALVLFIYLRGPTAIFLFGHSVSLYPPGNLLTATYALVFARFWLGWRRNRQALRERLGLGGRTLFYWHLSPVAISLLIPKRLAALVWFVGPANNPTPHAPYDLLSAAEGYWRAFRDGFSVAPWAAVAAIVLALLGASQIRRFAPPARAVFVFALVGALGVIIHPQHQGRFLASWLFAVWICAGAGAAVLLGWLIPQRPAWPRPALAAVVVAIFAAASAIQTPSPKAMAIAIRATSGPSDLDLARPYLPALDGLRRVGVAATFGNSFLFQWMLQERCQCEVVVEQPTIGPSDQRGAVRDALLAELAASRAERWVLLDAPGSAYSAPALGYVYPRTAGLADAMRAQSRLVPVAVYHLPGEGAAATIYAPASP
jgi:hypothetical protein